MGCLAFFYYDAMLRPFNYSTSDGIWQWETSPKLTFHVIHIIDLIAEVPPFGQSLFLQDLTGFDKHA
jgi:hypothetical protein